MIHEACNELTSMGFTKMKKFTDDFGTIGYGVRFMNQDYILVAKEYSHDQLASFLARLVVKAPDPVDFIFYNNDTENFTVFDGQYLRANSEESSGPSKKRDCAWREIPLSHGAELDSYIKGQNEPATLSGKNETLEAFL